jgi:LacI family transcriptional regulator
VTLDRPLYKSAIPSVVVDNFSGARMATQHLIEHGYKRILCLTGETTLHTMRERLRGYRQTIEAAGLPAIVDTSIKDYKSTEYAIESQMAGAHPPDAIFTLKNGTTIFAIEALQKLRIPVPRGLALMGFDDFELAATLKPSISVVQQPVEDIGRIAAELMFEQLLPTRKGRGAGAKRSSHVKLETRLVLRQSCGCTPASSE